MSTSKLPGKRLSGFFSRLTLSSGIQKPIEAPVPRLLTSNDPPSDAERNVIETAIIHAKQRKEKLIEALQSADSASQVICINGTLSDIDTFIDTQRSILSPLRGLPQDLLSLIFTLCLEPITTRPWNQTYWHDLPSFPVSQVCQWWRTVALNTPQLWCILGDIRLNRKTNSRTRYSYANFIDTLLSRSRTLDLWIYVYAPFQEFETHRVVEPLVRHAERWRVVTFQTTATTVNAFRAAKHRLLRLRHVSLDMWRGQAVDNIDCFSSAPVLTDFNIYGVYVTPILPWLQLKSYSEETTSDDGSALGYIFNHASTELEFLSVKVTPITLLTMMTSARAMMTCLNAPVTFPKLKALRLILPTDSPNIDVESLFRVLTLTNLEELEIYGCKNSFAECLLHLFRRSFQSLQHPPLKRLYLSVDTPAFSGFHFDSLLRFAPYLRHLEVELTTLLGIFDALLGTDGNSQAVPIIPKLESLIVHWDWFLDPPDFEQLVDACNTLTKVRCSSPIDGDHGHEQSVLQVKLMFESREEAFVMQKYLNKWHPYPAVWDYQQWCSRLRYELPALRGEKNIRLDPKVAQRLDGLLADIQNTELQDVRLLYVSIFYFFIINLTCQILNPCTQASSLHFVFRDLSQLDKLHILQDDIYMFRARAKATLDKWNEVIQADIANEESPLSKNWVLKGERCLQYIANYDGE